MAVVEALTLAPHAWKMLGNRKVQNSKQTTSKDVVCYLEETNNYTYLQRSLEDVTGLTFNVTKTRNEVLNSFLPIRLYDINPLKRRRISAFRLCRPGRLRARWEHVYQENLYLVNRRT